MRCCSSRCLLWKTAVALIQVLSVSSLLSAAVMGNVGAKHFGNEAQSVLKKSVSSESGITELATFAGGCFWGIELAFQRVPGVLHTEVGYTQGHMKNPTYEQVCSGRTGHTEAVQLKFDPAMVSYDELLTVFWDRINPTQLNKQGNDVGTQYRSGIYYHTEEQKEEAFASRDREQKKWTRPTPSNEVQTLPIVTEILPAAEWYKAEEYHQAYLEKGGQCARKGDTSSIRCYG